MIFSQVAYSVMPSSPDLMYCSISQGILDRLGGGEVVIGDGGFVFALEKRGYVKAGPWTPEAAAEHPEAGMCTRARRMKNIVHQNNCFISIQITNFMRTKLTK